MHVAAPEVQVTIPSALRSLCRGQTQFCLAADHVRGLLAELSKQYPEIHVRLCDERGEPRPHINVFVNADHIRTRSGLDTPLTAGDLVYLLPAVSGG